MPAKLDPLDALEKEGPRCVYAIDGDETILIDEALAAIKNRTLSKGARDFNLDAFSGRSAKLPRIIDAARTLPAFAPKRLVIVTQADKLDLEASAELLEYLASPNPTTVLVFIAERFDARTKLYKAFQRAGAVLRFERPKPREVPEFLRARAQRMGVQIDASALRSIADAVGTDLSRAIQWLEILTLYVGPGEQKKITSADVEAVVSSTKEESIFALVDAIGLGDRSTALKGLHGILEVSREHPLRALAMIARHYRNLIKARSVLDANRPKSELQALTGLPPFLIDGLMNQARRSSLEVFSAGLAAIDRTDRDLKGGALDDFRAMERLVLFLLRGGRAAG